MSTAVTNGIRVEVKSRYVPDRSNPVGGQYVFAYTVLIANEGDVTTQLLSRHWMITDNQGELREVKGDGVVGEQPILRPGQSFEYTSWCVLPTSSGSMRGTYQMIDDDGIRFDAEIAPFRLGLPNSLN